ncbi:MAG: hypothetical protein BGO86_09880 [Chryseobacterium sp. 36-9]|nr:MAG: hypothetical protein BGO86_09880 [Chryseobacterium sp. 36-9]
MNKSFILELILNSKIKIFCYQILSEKENFFCLILQSFFRSNIYEEKIYNSNFISNYLKFY